MPEELGWAIYVSSSPPVAQKMTQSHTRGHVEATAFVMNRCMEGSIMYKDFEGLPRPFW